MDKMQTALVIFSVFVKFSDGAITWDDQCGVTKGCFPDCRSSACTYLVTWQVPSGTDSVKFEIYFEESGTSWVGLAFSSDKKMGDDSGVACLTSNNGVISFYNIGTSTSQLTSPTTGLTSTSVSQANGIISCTVTRDNTANADSKYFDLKSDYYIFLGTGPASGSSMLEHSRIPHISSVVADFQSTAIVGSATITPLVKLHACSMVLAWMLFSCIGIIIARYQKKMLKEKEVLGAKIWFQLHRLTMIFVMVFVIIGFIAIFVEAEGYSENISYFLEAIFMKEASLPEKDVSLMYVISRVESEEHEYVESHPVLGIIITCLAMINPTMAIFRPNPDHKHRFIFNWAHRIVGVLAHILSVITLFFGYGMPSVEEVLEDARNATIAWIVLHSVICVILEVIKWWIQFKEETDTSNKTFQLLNQILMLIHAISMVATTLAAIIIIGKA